MCNVQCSNPNKLSFKPKTNYFEFIQILGQKRLGLRGLCAERLILEGI